MKYVYGLIVAIAALLVGANSGFELWQKYNRGQNLATLSAIETQNAFGIAPDPEANINFVTDVEQRGTSILSNRSGNKYAVVPIVAYPVGTMPNSLLRRSRLFSGRQGVGKNPKTPQGQPARICAGSYIVDFKIYNFETASSKLLYSSPVAITQYELFTFGERDNRDFKLLIVFIDEDTNGDGILTCNDRRKLATYDLKADEYEVLNISLEPNLLNKRHSYGDVVAMSFGIDENEDGYFDATSERSEPYLFDIRTNKLISLNE